MQKYDFNKKIKIKLIFQNIKQIDYKYFPLNDFLVNLIFLIKLLY